MSTAIEIARTGAVDITRRGTDCARTEARQQVSYLRSRTTPFLQILAGLILLAPILGLTGVAVNMSRTLPETLDHRRRAHRWVAKVGVVASALLALITWRVTLSEPRLFFEGVSSVPAFIMQLSSVVFCVSFLRIASGRTGQNHARIEEDFGLKPPCRWSDFIGKGPSIARWKRDMDTAHTKGREEALEDVWATYWRLDQWMPQLLALRSRCAD